VTFELKCEGKEKGHVVPSIQREGSNME
jgi:hypothetical protein